MKSTEKYLQELTDLLTMIAKLPKEEGQAIFQLLIHLGEALRVTLKKILDTTSLMQQSELSITKQKECVDSIRVSSNTLLKLISDVVIQAQTELGKQRETTTKLQQSELKRYIKDLAGINVLVVGEQVEQCNSLVAQLIKNGLKAKTETFEAALYTAEQERVPLQILIVIAKTYDHHTAYLGRTIRANNLLSGLMMVLALPNELLDFERDQIHFDGFSCILNLSDPEFLVANLANSWRGWAAKIQFTETKAPLMESRILLVEDDQIAQKAVQWQLDSLGYAVDIASDGHTALKLLRQKVYNLIFMDIGLPDISGLEVTAEIRKQERDHHIPIVGLTMYKTEHDLGLKAGMDELLIKPLLPEQLQAVLQRWVKKSV